MVEEEGRNIKQFPWKALLIILGVIILLLLVYFLFIQGGDKYPQEIQNILDKTDPVTGKNLIGITETADFEARERIGFSYEELDLFYIYMMRNTI